MQDNKIQTALNLTATATTYISFYQGELKVQAKHLIKRADGGAKGREEYTTNERQNVKGITLEMTLLCYCCLSGSNLL